MHKLHCKKRSDFLGLWPLTCAIRQFRSQCKIQWAVALETPHLNRLTQIALFTFWLLYQDTNRSPDYPNTENTSIFRSLTVLLPRFLTRQLRYAVLPTSPVRLFGTEVSKCGPVPGVGSSWRKSVRNRRDPTAPVKQSSCINFEKLHPREYPSPPKSDQAMNGKFRQNAPKLLASTSCISLGGITV